MTSCCEFAASSMAADAENGRRTSPSARRRAGATEHRRTVAFPGHVANCRIHIPGIATQMLRHDGLLKSHSYSHNRALQQPSIR